MGNAQVSELNDINQAITNVCTNIVNNTQNITQTNCVATNDVKINVAGSLSCGVQIDQNAKTLCQLSANMTNLNQNSVANQLTSQLQALLQSGQSSTQAFLATALSAQISQQNLSNIIQNVITTNITNDIFNSCTTSALSINGTEINVGNNWTCPTNAPNITINQNGVSQASAQCLADNTVKALLDNTTISGIVAQMVSQQQSQQSGLASLTGMFALVIVGVIVLIIAGVFLLPKLMGGGGSGLVSAPRPSAFSTNKYLMPALIAGGVLLLIIIIIIIVIVARRNEQPPAPASTTPQAS